MDFVCESSHFIAEYHESERTCVVYGMPFALEKAGLSDEILDLEQIADVMFKRMR